MHTARCLWLGRRPYEPVHELQKRLQAERRAGQGSDVVLLVEHEPVITLGRGAKRENLIAGEDHLRARGVDLVATARGGDVTYHGPGQLVGYPILDLRPDRCDVRRYVRTLIEVMVLIARDHGVESGCVDGFIGAWADAENPSEWGGVPWARQLVKIGAIGVHISRWVTMHGFALNLAPDLRDFSLIVPCGIRDHAVASVESLTGHAPRVRDVAMAAAPHLTRGLGWRIETIEDASSAELDRLNPSSG
jgi:lipoyl(octanoyl) transferase